MIKTKRGQVTIFVIIAILIVGVVIGLTLIKNKTSSITTPSIPKNIQPIQDFVQNCLKETSENALIRIGEQGGYFFIPESIPSVNGKIPYYLLGDQILIPEKEAIQSQLSWFIKEELGFCILNFKDFRSKVNISSGLIQVKSIIFQDRVSFNLKYPLIINQEEQSSTLENFNTLVLTNVDLMYFVANEIIKEQQSHPKTLCLSCVYDLGKRYNLDIDLLDYENSTIFTITNPNIKINNQTSKLVFAIK